MGETDCRFAAILRTASVASQRSRPTKSAFRNSLLNCSDDYECRFCFVNRTVYEFHEHLTSCLRDFMTPNLFLVSCRVSCSHGDWVRVSGFRFQVSGFRFRGSTQSVFQAECPASLLNSRAKFAAGCHETSRICGLPFRFAPLLHSVQPLFLRNGLPQGDGSWQDAVKLAALRVRNSAMQFVTNLIFQDNACILLIINT